MASQENENDGIYCSEEPCCGTDMCSMQEATESDASESWVEWGVRRTWGPATGTVASGDMNRRTAEKCAREWPGELVSRVVIAAPWQPVNAPEEHP